MDTALPRNLSDEALEEWFLNHLEQGRAAFAQMLAALGALAAKLQYQKAEACADLLLETLKTQAAEKEILRLLEYRADWQTDQPAYARACFKTLQALFQGQNRKQLYVAACGLQAGLAPKEALRRLQTLDHLQPGKYCYEKTWGAGRVAGIDEFDRQIIIDFEKKKAHRLAFAYAAETVQPLDDNHFLALKLRAPDTFQRWLEEKPAEAVKALLNYFGAMPVNHLRACATSLLISENNWNSFWAAAREQLHSDPLVQMPARREEPIRLLSAKKEFNEQWLRVFAAERDCARILSEVESLFAGCPPETIPADLRKTIVDRLKFVAQAAGLDQPDKLVRALLLAELLELTPAVLADISVYQRPEVLVAALNALPAKMIRSFLKYLDRRNSRPADEVLAGLIPRLFLPALNELVMYFCERGREQQMFAALRGLLQTGQPGVEMVAWLARNLPLLKDNKVCRLEIFVQAVLNLLQGALAAGRRKEIGQLQAILANQELLETILPAMEPGQRLDFCRRLNALTGLPSAAGKKIAAKIILLFPDLAPAFSGPAASAAPPRLTSLRSYREKQAQLHKIMTEEIPRNSKEIGVARGYGDLRENYEYKAAREMQGLLMRRKAELEKMLAEVKSTDFAGFPHELAGQGASVELQMPDEKKTTYHILGEWDSDQKLGIISCRSKLAEALQGRRAGETVEIPGENSPRRCVIAAVREPPPAIKAWINGD